MCSHLSFVLFLSYFPSSSQVFISGRNRLENEGAEMFAKFFKAVGTLEEVAMPQNGIFHVGIAALASAFSINSNLRIINLNDKWGRFEVSFLTFQYPWLTGTFYLWSEVSAICTACMDNNTNLLNPWPSTHLSFESHKGVSEFNPLLLPLSALSPPKEQRLWQRSCPPCRIWRLLTLVTAFWRHQELSTLPVPWRTITPNYRLASFFLFFEVIYKNVLTSSFAWNICENIFRKILLRIYFSQSILCAW